MAPGIATPDVLRYSWRVHGSASSQIVDARAARRRPATKQRIRRLQRQQQQLRRRRQLQQRLRRWRMRGLGGG
jgi:hypothetical protein